MGDSKLAIGVSVSLPGCLSVLTLDRQPIQDVHHLSSNASWDRLQSFVNRIVV